ncbi:MAG: malto-oligosyltrehalose trehalohydrolase [Halofilum sp. (in: g-proteobacteria)]
MSAHIHRMPFGAAVMEDGRVRFGVWAPGADEVTLRIEDTPMGTELMMAPESNGWFGIVTGLAVAGSRYRFRIDGGEPLPDPASRYQPEGVHGPSEVIDPGDYGWRPTDWRGRPWHEAVIYELHVGAFTAEGTFTALAERLDHLVSLGVTAIELMPVAAFAGARNWGYDGVLPFAPDATYGRPEDLKALVEAAHDHGLMVLLDVVYNHFGPEGNYLPRIAPDFFSTRHDTPWGAAINFDGPGSGQVRAFVIENALYWLKEFALDGLRLDAVDTIVDDSSPDIVSEIAARVRRVTAAGRYVHLVAENDRNEARYLERDARGRSRAFDAQWNDDFHHAAHILATGEDDGYYRDYADRPAAYLGRCLAEGFGYQGEPSAWRGGHPRGSVSRHLPPTAFVDFLQNHDQIGNRACGERLASLAPPEAVRAFTAVLLLAPQPPLLFMGQEWATTRPFLFFCDFEPDIARKVAAGRRQEFAGFRAFSGRSAPARIPDPGAAATFARSVLDWDEPTRKPYADWLELHRELLGLRQREIIPRLAGAGGHSGQYRTHGASGVAVDWSLGDAGTLRLRANLGPDAISAMDAPSGRVLHASPGWGDADLPAWSVRWYLGAAGESGGEA